jgi:hypothetical protein
VFRHATPEGLTEVDKALRTNLGALLREARVVVDHDGRLGPAGLLAQAGQGEVAAKLVAGLVR